MTMQGLKTKLKQNLNNKRENWSPMFKRQIKTKLKQNKTKSKKIISESLKNR